MTTQPLKDWFSDSMRKAHVLPTPALLGKLTVVIPCYARQDFLLRQCVYWRGSRASIVIVDGSPEPLCESVRGVMDGAGNITYIHAPITMMERLKLAAQRIDTPYAILHGDDEFLLFGGLCSAIQKLESDGSLVACIAQSLAFHVDSRGGEVTYGNGYPHWQYAIAQKDVAGRLMAAMSDYTAATCYAVLRTDTWRRSWGQLQNWSSPYVGEMQQGITTYVWGKLATVEPVYWMRSSENKPVTSTDFNRGVTFKDWWIGRKFDVERERLLGILSKELADSQGMLEKDARSMVELAIQTFLEHQDGSSRTNERELNGLRAAWRTLRKVLTPVLRTVLPTHIRDYLKSTLFGLTQTAARGNFGALQDLQKLTPPIPFEMSDNLIVELTGMESLIRSFNIARLTHLP